MSTSLDLDRLMEAFLEDGPAVLTDRVSEAIRDDVERTEQRAVVGPWRTPLMSRYAIAAAIVTIALLGGVAIYAALLQPPNVGPPAESPAPDPSELGAMPAELQYAFLGPAKPIEGFDDYQIDRGDLYYEGTLLAFGIGNQAAFYSIPSITADGDLRLTSGVDGACANGDEGTYPWSLSPGGTILTIEPGTDDCAARAQAVPGTYQRAACKNPDNSCLGELEAGVYASHFIEPRPLGPWAARHGAMTYTVPSGWASYSDWPNLYGLTPLSQYQAFDPDQEDCYDCAGTRDTVSILGQPGAATEDCQEESTVPGVGFGRQDLVDWLTTHPGLSATGVEDWTLGGLMATSLVIEAADDWTGTCDPENPFVAVPVFFGQEGDYHLALNVGDRWHVTLIDLGDGNTVAVVVDTANQEDLDSFVDEATPIIESFAFPAP